MISRPADRAERGAALLVILTALSAMVLLGGLAVLAVRGQTQGAAYDRFRTLALYGAESGLAAGMEFLRNNRDDDTRWGAFVVAGNIDAVPELGITGNTIEHGAAGNPFTDDNQVWYEVTILNNPEDPGFAGGTDDDGIVILRAIGHGPAGATAVVALEFQPTGSVTTVPCAGYAQENQNEHGSAFNPCQGSVDSADSNTLDLNP